MQYLRVQYIASPNKWNLWQIWSMVCLYVKPRYLENCHFFDLFWQTFARPLHGGVGFPFEICMPCWKHPSANQQYEETHEEETSAPGFQQQMPDVDHFIKGRKNGTTVRAIIWLIFCLWKIRGRKEICQICTYVHGGGIQLHTIYKPGTQYGIEITTIQVAMWLQRGHNNTHSECRYTMDTMGTQRGGWSRWRRTIYGEARHRQMRRTLAYLIIGRSWVATKSL